ncbi:MAG: RHS repeat-associated core domain-containing protein, partial [Actinomycetota bacterium]
KVNLANGNLVLSQSDLSIAGLGLDLSISHTYNSLLKDQETSAGKGWRLSSDTRLAPLPNGSVMLHGAGGEAILFEPQGGGGAGFKEPTELDAKLTHEGVGYLLAFDGGGELRFDSQGRPSSQKDRSQNELRFSYAGGIPTSILDTRRRALDFESSDGLITEVQDSAGRTHTYSYQDGRLAAYTDPIGYQTHYTYDAQGRLTRVTDPAGTQSAFTYDQYGRVTSIAKADNIASLRTVTQIAYGLALNPCDPTEHEGKTVVTDPLGRSATYCYDDRGWVTKTADSTDARTQMTLNQWAQPTQVTATANGEDPLTSVMEYDQDGKPLSSEDPEGATSETSYTDPQNPQYPTAVTNAQGNTEQMSYDQSGNLTQVSDAGQSGASSTLTYNPNGTPASATDARGNTTTYAYDQDGHLTRATPPAPLGAATMSYDSLSRPTSATDALGQTQTITYDALDRPVAVSFSDGSTFATSYDAAGNATQTQEPAGMTTYTYDALGQMTSETKPTGQTEAYTYDRSGALTSATDSGETTTYHYDSAGRLASTTDPDGDRTTYTYDALSRPTTTTLPNGVSQTKSFDGSGNLTRIRATAGGSILQDLQYTYKDAQGNQTSQIQSQVDAKRARTTNYTYDSIERLTKARTYEGQAVVDERAYAYDGASNMVAKVENGDITNFSYNAANQLTQMDGTSYSYDANGNLLSDSSGRLLTYNAKDQTASIRANLTSPPIAMSYLGSDQSEQVGDGDRTLKDTALGLSAVSGPGGTSQIIRSAGGEPIGEETPQGKRYYLTDVRGSVVGATDESGSLVKTYQYEPFGEVTGQTGSGETLLRYAGGYQTSSGLYHYGKRFYDPQTSRWTQPDPAQDPGDLRQQNAYSYA